MAMTRTRVAAGAAFASIIGALAGNGAFTLLWAVADALLAHRPRGWGAVGVLLVGCGLGAFYGWQIGQAICLDAEPEQPPQTPGAQPQPPPATGPRQGWVRRMATTRAKLWRHTTKEEKP